MLNKRLAVMIGGTAACALGIGFVMQKTIPAPQPVPVIQAQTISDPVIQTNPVSDEPLEIDGITLTSAQPDEDLIVARSTAPDQLPETPKDPKTPRLGCDVDLSAIAVDQGHVRIGVIAPCQQNERLTVHHSGLMFSAATDENGIYSVLVPAMSEQAVFIVDFANGTDMVASVSVSDLAEYDRIAVQWSGNSGFEIHAREFGAGYGDDGHVWSGTDTSATGQVVRLGENQGLNPLMAEVYTFPRATNTQSGSIAMTVETEVTAHNCGKDVSAQSIELRGGQSLRTRDMVLSVPNCSAIGDFLVLNNLVDDLKIAAK
ncbi:hypothetical protein K3727_01290 [Rhodobacteraceae bacterium M382]|nr:hypothetical protein K3727_01290 [Rhodobacteraceae bacterium M382]